MTRILGIDPGTKVAGFALLEDGELKALGTFKLKGTLDERLYQLWDYLRRLEYDDIDLVAIEIPPGVVFGRRPDTGLILGQAVGVVCAFCAFFHYPVARVNPSTAKKAFAGHGRADKQAMIDAAREKFGLEMDANEADACAVAWTVWRRRE